MPILMTDETRAKAYKALSAKFRDVKEDVRGGARISYITGEQAITRLNEVLGVDGWEFSVLEHGIHAEADEVWVLAEMVVTFRDDDGATRTAKRQQFGSQKIKRSRASGTPLDIGFDLKGATTDALKKNATLFGVALYLSQKADELHAPGYESGPGDPAPARQETRGDARGDAPAAGTRQNAPAPGNAQGSKPGAQGDDGPAQIVCKVEGCGAILGSVRLRDGSIWTPAQLANEGLKRFKRPLCATHFAELVALQDAEKKAQAEAAS